MKSWLQDNNIEMYSTHNEGKSVVAERFLRILKNKICIFMTSISKNVYIYKLSDIADECNNTYQSPIKIKATDIEFGVKSDDKDRKFEVDDQIRISKYKNIFAKGYTPN